MNDTERMTDSEQKLCACLSAGNQKAIEETLVLAKELKVKGVRLLDTITTALLHNLVNMAFNGTKSKEEGMIILENMCKGLLQIASRKLEEDPLKKH